MFPPKRRLKQIFLYLLYYGLVVQLVRTLACHARGQGFESLSGRQNASVAQLVEQGTENPRVVGSIPTGGTINADLAHLVERNLAKVEVAGSSPVIRSKSNILKRMLLLSKKENLHILLLRRRSQAVRQKSAKLLFPGPIPGGASKTKSTS